MILWFGLAAAAVTATLVTGLAILSAAETLEDPLAQMERARLEDDQ